MSRRWMLVAVVGVMVAVGSPELGVAQASPSPVDTYTWPAELVSVDAVAKTMTVKARVAYPEAVLALKHFKAGDRVWVVWSGLHDSTDAVREVRRSETGRTIGEPLVLPAELVSTEAPNQYLTIRVRVPENALSAIGTVKPGEWVTVTSFDRPATDDRAVVAVRPYAAGTTTS
jgi:hypothetical protein